MSAWLEGLTIDLNNPSRGESHFILALYHMAHRRLGPLTATLWIMNLLMSTPYLERMK